MPVRESLEIERADPQGGSQQAAGSSSSFKQAVAAGVSVGLVVIIIAIFLARGGSSGGGRSHSGDGDVVIPAPATLPKYYGQIGESNIWIWQDGKPSDFAALCMETIELHKGQFEVRKISKDSVWDYVSPSEMPPNWSSLSPRYQRDSTMNALLARYGGIVLDEKTMMFNSLDDWWQGMDTEGVTFRGFRYNTRAEMATWFMMARREGIMRTAATEQAFGTSGCPDLEKQNELCYGSSILSLALCRYQSQYCKCFEDQQEGCSLLQWKNLNNLEDIAGGIKIESPEKTGVQPRLKPMGKDKVKVEVWPLLDKILEEDIGSISAVVREVPFLTLQRPAGADKKTREELLGDKDTYVYFLLCKSDTKGEMGTDGSACNERDDDE